MIEFEAFEYELELEEFELEETDETDETLEKDDEELLLLLI